MKAKSRKRLLISSIAMLLVAMLALGTATFAWFTSNTTATASKLSVSTVKVSEILLSKATGDWTDTLEYNYMSKTLKPVSSSDGVNWFKATAQNKNGDAVVVEDGTATTDLASAGTISVANQGITGYLFAEQLNVKNSGGKAVNNVTINFNLTETQANSGNYLRLAIVPVSARATSSALPTPAATAFRTTANQFSAAADTADAVNSATLTAQNAISTTTITTTSGASASYSVGNLAAAGDVNGGDVKYFNIYVWFEGQDTDCKDANAGNEMPALTFTVGGTPAGD